MANRNITLKRNNAGTTEELYPTTDWAQVNNKPSTFTPTSHSHGNITNGGAITANATIATGDHLVIADNSASNALTTSSITFDTTATTQFLRRDGVWTSVDAGNGFVNTTGDTMTGNLSIENAGPNLTLKDTTDSDDISFHFKNSSDTVVGAITTAGNQLNIETSFTNGLEIDADKTIISGGNVGIGTTSPTEKLTVYGDSNTSENSPVTFIKHNFTGTHGFGLSISRDNSDVAALALGSNSSLQGVVVANNQNLILGTISSGVVNDAINIQTGGNVGIGTNSPSQKLQVEGNINADELHLNDTDTKLVEGGGNSVRIQTNSGYVDVGPRNTSWSHFITDRSKFYFGTGIDVDGNIRAYSNNTTQIEGSTGHIFELGNRVLTTASEGSGNGLDADTVDTKHASDFATRIDLSSQVQLSSYRKSVIALCELTNTNPSANSWSGGTLYFHRTNGLSAPVTLQIAMEKRYNVVGANYTALAMSGDSYGNNIQYVQFDYNGTTYGGIEFYFSAAEHHKVYFIGETNFDIFGLDYYNTQTSTVLNSEVNSSISTSNMTAETDFFYNNNTIWHSGNDGSGSGLDADTLDGQQGSYYAPKASPALTGTPTAPTAAANTNTTQIATTAYVQQEITDLIGGAPGALDTLNELAAAINDDASYASTITTALAGKVAKSGDTMTGTLTYTRLNGPSSQTRDKVRVWNGSQYTIGMKSGYTYGGLNNDYAMSFQMNDDNDRGFWWGDQAHTDAQGAMALTTDGRLTVANRARIGYGESDTTAPSTYGLDVSGNSYIDATSASATLTLGRYSGQPTIKAGTDDSGYLIMDSTGGKLGLNWYSSDDVSIGLGGGNVGIGTSSPSAGYKLQVDGNIKLNGSLPKIQFTDTDNDSDFHIANNNGVLEIADTTNQLERFKIDSSGNVTLPATGGLTLVDKALTNSSGSLLWDGDEIYHEGHKPTYTELGTMAYSNLTGTPTIPTNNNQLTNGAGYTTNTGTVTSVATGGGLTGGTITGSGTISHADTSSQASVNNSGNTFIQDITLDTYGHITAITSATATGGGSEYEWEYVTKVTGASQLTYSSMAPADYEYKFVVELQTTAEDTSNPYIRINNESNNEYSYQYQSVTQTAETTETVLNAGDALTSLIYTGADLSSYSFGGTSASTIHRAEFIYSVSPYTTSPGAYTATIRGWAHTHYVSQSGTSYDGMVQSTFIGTRDNLFFTEHERLDYIHSINAGGTDYHEMRVYRRARK